MAAYGLTPAEETRCKAIFNSFDSNGDGTLTLEELKSAYRGTGWSDLKIKHYFKKLDKDGSQRVDLDEFLQSMAPVNKTPKQIQQTELLRQTFKTFDKNGDNFISRDELQAGLRNVYPTWTDQQVKDRVTLWMECDANNDNKINYEEFLDIVSQEL